MVDSRCWALTLAIACAGSAASAADLPMLAQAPEAPAAVSPWAFLNGAYVHVGPAALIIDAGAKIFTPLGRVPGATIKIAPQVTASAELGYFFTPNWAVSVALGVPPTANIDGAGTAEPFGRLGETLYGPVAVTGHYHFTNFGPFQPYIGGGPTVLIDFGSTDRTLTRLSVHSAVGVLGQVGADYMITQHLGAFIDFKKAYLRTFATGHLAGVVPIRADVKLDPYVLSGGVTYRF